MAGKQQQQQCAVVAAEPSVARRMWRVVRAVLYMLRRGLPSGRKLAMDLHLLLHRGKIAGKALGDLLAFHHRVSAAAKANAGGRSSSFSCRALDPSLAVHEPARCGRREVEFSCSNTPCAGDDNAGARGLHLLGAGKRGRRSRNNRRDESANGYLHWHNYDAADVAKVFEMLNSDDDGGRLFSDYSAAAVSATPSPAQLLWAFARSPAAAASKKKQQQQLRIADSPLLQAEDAQVDRQADEFIRRFYEQLRAQKSAASTPDYYAHSSAATSPYAPAGRAPRPLAAGIA